MDIMEKRLNYLDDLMQKIAYEHLNNEIAINNLTRNLEESRKRSEMEMTGFKEELLRSRQRWKQENEEYNNRMERLRNDLNKKWGELANKMGTIVEDIVLPNIPDIAAKYFGVETLSLIASNVKKEHPEKPGEIKEFDVLAVGGDYLFINETKSTPRQDYLEKFAGDYAVVLEYFPEYREKTIVPIFSSLSLPESAVNYLSGHGIYAMTMKGDTMELLNYEAVTST